MGRSQTQFPQAPTGALQDRDVDEPLASQNPAGDPDVEISAQAGIGDLQDLVEHLRLLPDVWPRAPPLWVPRRLKQQVAAVLQESLQAAVTTAGAIDGSVDAEVAHRLAKAMPQLLLRNLSGEQQDDSPDTCNQSYLTLVRTRLRAARAQAWLTLVQDAIDDVARAKAGRESFPQAATDPQAPLSAQAAQAAVLRARTGALRSAAAQLVGGPPVPPSEAAHTMINELFPAPLTDEQAAQLTCALESAQSVGLHQRLRTTPRLIGRQLNMLKPAAGPGPSGYRNTHVLCIASDPAGHQALQAWADIWARGSIAPWQAAIWTPSIARPFWKTKSQQSVRPVLCGEALLKFAMGVCVLGSEKQIQAAVGPKQYGVNGNPEQVINQVRAAAAHRPNRALLSLDFKNAFGSIRWADALVGLTAAVPRLAVPIACQWAQRSTQVFVQTGLERWEPIAITGGLTQGFVEAKPAFCVVLANIMQEALASPGLDLLDDPLFIDWAYIDDWTLQSDVPKVPTLRNAIDRCAAEHGLQLQPKKCQLHIPSLRGMPVESWPPECRAAAEAFPPCPNGITLLGTEATAQFETMLDEAPAAEQAGKRLRDAQQLADRLVELLRLTPPAGAKQAVWTLNRCIVAQSLSYDFRVLPCAIVAPHAELLEKAVNDVAAAVIDLKYTDLNTYERKQMHLPTRCGGLQLIRPTRIAPLARAAALMEGGPTLRQAIAAWPDCTEQQACQYDGVDADIDGGLMQRLHAQGIHSIAGDGTPVVGAQPPPVHPETTVEHVLCHAAAEAAVERAGLVHNTQHAADLRPPVPARHLLSAMLRHVADKDYDELLNQAPKQHLPRLRSAAGPTAGASLVAPLSTPGVKYTDEEWSCTLRRRLGVPPIGPLQPHGMRMCQNFNASKGKICGEPLDVDGVHAAICPCGPLTNLCHDGLSDLWCDVLDETGLCTRRELYVPSLSTPQQEAWLDVGTFGSGELAQRLFDITVRHPGAARYADAATKDDGATASRGRADKAQRYGDSVTALVHESWGRLNIAAEELLSSASAAAARLDWRRGRIPGQRAQRWRAQLDAELQRAQAAMQHSAVHGLPGKPNKRPATVDLTMLQMQGAWPTPRW